MALDVPASSSDADRRTEEAPEERVADRSPMAAEAGGLSERAARRGTNTRIVTPTISVRQRLREIWLSRELLIYLVRTEIKVKYKNSVLGLIWSMVAPAMTLAIYFFVFQIILSNKQPNFVIFLFAGLLHLEPVPAWRPDRDRRRREQRRDREEGLVPPRDPRLGVRRARPACSSSSRPIVMVIFMVVLHHGPDWSYMPVLLLALVTGIVLASALAVLLSSVNVYLRDMQHLIEVVLTAWFWACPIVYAYQQYIGNKLGPSGKTWIYFLNPMVPLGAVVPALHLRRPTVVKIHRRDTVPFDVLPTKGMLWYVGLDLAVLLLGACLFIVALGRVRPARGQLRRGALIK